MTNLDLSDDQAKALALLLTLARGEIERSGAIRLDPEASWAAVQAGAIMVKLKEKGVLDKLTAEQRHVIDQEWGLVVRRF